uniref:U-box domain-containing protein 33-like isoform X2 n=1 Tax=Rhizophora mucronata TaxID=61149 RepID=A0A2P2J5S6_RHIMU
MCLFAPLHPPSLVLIVRALLLLVFSLFSCFPLFLSCNLMRMSIKTFIVGC